MTDVGNLLPLGSITTAGTERISESQIPPERQMELARQFESMFTSLLLKEMRQTSGEEGLFQGESSDTMGGMFDMFMGEHIAKEGGLGIAHMVQTYLENSA
jgi:Rod binding domain-containing protein